MNRYVLFQLLLFSQMMVLHNRDGNDITYFGSFIFAFYAMYLWEDK